MYEQRRKELLRGCSIIVSPDGRGFISNPDYDPLYDPNISEEDKDVIRNSANGTLTPQILTKSLMDKIDREIYDKDEKSIVIDILKLVEYPIQDLCENINKNPENREKLLKEFKNKFSSFCDKCESVSIDPTIPNVDLVNSIIEEIFYPNRKVRLLPSSEVDIVEVSTQLNCSAPITDTTTTMIDVEFKEVEETSQPIVYEKKKKIVPGLDFSNLVVKDIDHEKHVVPVPIDVIGVFDNTGIIVNFNEMAKIQEIIRGMNLDVKMTAEGTFILCEVFKDKVLYKSFVVDYLGVTMNKFPKIFFLDGNKEWDECEAIHFSDTINLSNFLNNKPLEKSGEPVVTDTQRMIVRSIINYGYRIPENEIRSFEEILAERVVPFINENYKSKHNMSFRILNYKSPSAWTLASDNKTPVRFGSDVMSQIGGTVYFHANGYTNDGKVRFTINSNPELL